MLHSGRLIVLCVCHRGFTVKVTVRITAGLSLFWGYNRETKWYLGFSVCRSDKSSLDNG